MELLDLIKNNKNTIQRVEVLGEYFYYSCDDISSIMLKENKSLVLLLIGNFIINSDNIEDFQKELKKEDNYYLYEYKEMKIKFITLKEDEYKEIDFSNKKSKGLFNNLFDIEE